MKTTTWNLLPVAMVLLPLPAGANAGNPPVGNAGVDQSINLGDAAFLQGSTFDPDGDPLGSWERTLEFKPEGSLVFLWYPNAPNWLLDPDLVGDYIVSLVAYADGGTGGGFHAPAE